MARLANKLLISVTCDVSQSFISPYIKVADTGSENQRFTADCIFRCVIWLVRPKSGKNLRLAGALTELDPQKNLGIVLISGSGQRLKSLLKALAS